MIKSILIGLFCFILFLSVHAAVFRTVELKERFRALTVIFLSMVPVYLLLYLLIPSGYMVVAVPGPVNEPFIPVELAVKLTGLMDFSSGLALYIFLFLGYCQFYFIVDRSVSVRVMIEIESSRDKRLSLEDIRGKYPFEGMLSRRITHMLEGNYLTELSGYYANTKKGRIEARVFSFLKKFLRLGKGG